MDANVPSPARLQQVQVRYRDPAALQGIDLQVRAGQVRALLDRDATGKSSAVSTLPGMRLSSRSASVATRAGAGRLGKTARRLLHPSG